MLIVPRAFVLATLLLATGAAAAAEDRFAARRAADRAMSDTLRRDGIGADPDTADAIARHTGRSVERWKAEWMRALQAAPASRDDAAP